MLAGWQAGRQAKGGRLNPRIRLKTNNNPLLIAAFLYASAIHPTQPSSHPQCKAEQRQACAQCAYAKAGPGPESERKRERKDLSFSPSLMTTMNALRLFWDLVVLFVRSFVLSLLLYVYVYVCVCIDERARERLSRRDGEEKRGEEKEEKHDLEKF